MWTWLYLRWRRRSGHRMILLIESLSAELPSIGEQTALTIPLNSWAPGSARCSCGSSGGASDMVEVAGYLLILSKVCIVQRESG